MRNFDSVDNVVGGNNYSNVAILVYFLSVLPDEVTPEKCLFWGVPSAILQLSLLMLNTL